ncbi:MAG TPA: hypothetical protein VGJ19_02420 [Streptosporangiaceae bacterium]
MTQATGPIGPVLARPAGATSDLVAELDGRCGDQARGPSRVAGWSRGHVLAHLPGLRRGAPGC